MFRTEQRLTQHERKQEKEAAARARMPKFFEPSGDLLLTDEGEKKEPKLRLTQSMLDAGWTIDDDGKVNPPNASPRGNVVHISETGKANQQKAERKKKKKETPKEPTLLEKKEEELRLARVNRAKNELDQLKDWDEEVRRLVAEVDFLRKSKKSKPVPVTLYFVSGLKKQEMVENHSNKSPLDNARRVAISYLLYSSGEGQIAKVVIHGERTGDETHTRDEVKKFYCADKKVFDWDGYRALTIDQRIAMYRKDFQRKRIPAMPKKGNNPLMQKAKQTRVTFPKNQPHQYVGDWREVG